MIDKNKLIKICEEVAADTKKDAIEFDGQPFNGKTLGTYLGYHGAAIATLANVLKEILENDTNKQQVPSISEVEGHKI